MLNNEESDLLIPTSIELLFENEKLDLMKLLCLINSISLNRKRYVSVSELIFYFSLVNFNLITIFEGSRTNTSPNLFFRFQSKIGNLILKMYDLELVELKANVFSEKEDIKVKLSQNGMEFYRDHSSNFFEDLQGKYILAFEKVNYSATNLKRLKEGRV